MAGVEGLMVSRVDMYEVSRELARPAPDWAAQTRLQGTAASNEVQMFAFQRGEE
jgi:hypothetical protein